MKQKLRRLVRPGGTNDSIAEQSVEQRDLRGILLLEKNEGDPIRQFDLQVSATHRTFSKVRKNIEEMRSISFTRRDYTFDQSTQVQEGNSRSRERLPSLDSNPGKAIRSLMTQLNSKSMDKSSTVNYSMKSNIFNTEESTGPKMKVLKPNSHRLPSMNRPDSKTKEISKRMMDNIAGRIKQVKKVNHNALSKYNTEQGGIGVFLSDIGFTKANQGNSNKDDQKEGSLNNETQGMMLGLQPFINLFGGAIQEQEGAKVTDLLTNNLQKLMNSVSVLSGQELKDEQELIYYIKLLFTDDSQNHEFIYAINKKSELPYNLTPMPFSQIQSTQPQYYYTISKERIIKHRINKSVAEDSQMEEWLREKLKFNQLKTLEFIRKFRKIKTLKSWIGAIRKFKRKYAAKLIEFSLPILDPVLCKPILEFRQRCIDLQQLNYFYVSNDKICNVDELKEHQDKNNEYFVREIQRRDKYMNTFIREIIKSFNQMLWNTAFADLSDELKGGLAAIKCPDASLYEDGVEIDGTDLAFFHKLMTLNVPYRVKTKIRNICKRVLSMPLYFDSLRMASLMQCYNYNVERLQSHVRKLQKANTEMHSIWNTGKRPAANKKQEAYITVYFEIDDEYMPKHSQVDIQKVPVVIMKGKTSAVEPLEFDYSNNLTYRKLDFENFETKIVDEQTGLRDLQDLMSKGFMYDRNIPQMISLKSVSDPSAGLIKISPNFSELKDFLSKEYEDFVNVLSSFKKCFVSGEFNLYYKLMIHWAKEDLRPEDEDDSLNIRQVLDESDHKRFIQTVIDPIERDYSKISDVTTALTPLAQQHWRNNLISVESNP
jgi:hypothetical protein